MYDAHHGIQDISLNVKKGEVYGFLGPNGAGKSTTINAVLDILRADSGTILLFGQPHARVSQTHQRIGYLAGDMATDMNMTGRQYLKFVERIHGNVDTAYVAQLTSRLQAEVNTRIKHLSRGNKQKIGLIAALMHEPDLLILDEPTSGLDPLMQSEFNAIIREHRAKGKTAFISSHVLSEVQSLCDNVAFIRHGKIIKKGNLADIRDSAGQYVKCSFAEKPTTKVLQSLKNTSRLTIENDAISFLYHGDLDTLLKFFAKHTPTRLELHEPDLESLFMQYYEEKNDA